MANAAFGLQILELPSRKRSHEGQQEEDEEGQEEDGSSSPLLQSFLRSASSVFSRRATLTDGSCWSDFVNVLCSSGTTSIPGASEVEDRFMRMIFEPILQALEGISGLDGHNIPMLDALQELQQTVESIGIPHFGELFSREALNRLEMLPKEKEVPSWVGEARKRSRAAASTWRIPAADTIRAFLAWNVRCHELKLLNEGRVFTGRYSRIDASSNGSTIPKISPSIEELLRPLKASRPKLKRDGHPERQGLLVLLSELAEGTGLCTEEILDASQGIVQIYIGHYPCISCLAVFCQLQRRCPKIQLQVDFDNAWTTFFGRQR